MKKTIIMATMLFAAKSFACGSIGAYITKNNGDWSFSNGDCVSSIQTGPGGIAVIYTDPNYQVMASVEINDVIKNSGVWKESTNSQGWTKIVFFAKGTRTSVDPADLPDGSIITFGKYVKQYNPSSTPSTPEKKQYHEHPKS